MAHEYTNEIKCPYCDYEFSDSWEFNDSDECSEVDCPECGKEFALTVNIKIDYSTEKISCKDQTPPIPHEWDEPTFHDIDQEVIDRWNKEHWNAISDREPYRMWTRECKNCDVSEFKRVELGGDCPFIDEEK
ncbi:hypothetical protein [Maridesulfovibrio ferrireducens]|uniref:hypothetical protein n=1 Tax=Maridesulfovibrio ferrireducens TaxID=246191 RepID=UPI001A2AE71F|nr:hypothetical protein [Maridesulfovibrio ferrireducens]MBI9110251.1 hypothetical protein [Maridesulfovibrio ferrireducens]